MTPEMNASSRQATTQAEINRSYGLQPWVISGPLHSAGRLSLLGDLASAMSGGVEARGVTRMLPPPLLSWEAVSEGTPGKAREGAAIAATLGEGLRPRFTLLRWGFAVFLALVTCGLLLASYAVATAAGPLVTGISIIAIWAGGSAVTIAAHLEGRRSGDYLLGPRASWPAVVLAVGMTFVAVVATVEFSIK